MCGIVGYIGRKEASEAVLSGLRALEYRGYDSAGIALLDEKNQPHLVRQVGRVDGLSQAVEAENLPVAQIAIGHTRWATHGRPTIANAHPHSNEDGTIFVVHNGIIENYTQIKTLLVKAGYKFVSETDTEVIPHLIDFYAKRTKSFRLALEKALSDLRGAYAVAVLSTHEPDKLFVARLSSPLVIGVAKGATLIASDPAALLAHTKDIIYLHDNELAEISPKKHKIVNFKKAKEVKRLAERLDFEVNNATLGSFPNFMLKEIFEAPDTIRSATRGRIRPAQGTVKLGGLESVLPQLGYCDRIVIVACGTSYYAGLVGEYLIEELAGIPVEVQLASEFKYRHEPFSRSTALLAISQSGETADTIAALKKVKDYGCLRLGIVNATGSTITRLTDAGVYCHAGPEQAVASTKAFIAQVTVLLLIALELSRAATPHFKPLLKELEELPTKVEKILAQATAIEKVARKYTNARDFLFIGRGLAYPCALEGALKLKETSYVHAEGVGAGEMKHGPLAMIDQDFPTFAIATESPLLDKTYSNIEEIRARSGPVVAVATEGNHEIKKLADDVIFVPETLEQTQPLLVAIAMQLFSYYVAIQKGLDVDRPRNLAKSVTVE